MDMKGYHKVCFFDVEQHQLVGDFDKMYSSEDMVGGALSRS